MTQRPGRTARCLRISSSLLPWCVWAASRSERRGEARRAGRIGRNEGGYWDWRRPAGRTILAPRRTEMSNMQANVGDRIRWYELPEEVAH